MCIFIKHRVKDSEVESMQMIGDVKGRKVIIADDMCDTGGTLAKAMDMLRDEGASQVVGVTTHGVLSSPSYKVMQDKVLFVTNTCDVTDVQYDNRWTRGGAKYRKPRMLQVLTIKPFIESIISRINSNDKIGDLIDYWYPN
jgi:phosphoribosylpyrophosphate synthetase